MIRKELVSITDSGWPGINPPEADTIKHLPEPSICCQKESCGKEVLPQI
jgi:hypothetical protein